MKESFLKHKTTFFVLCVLVLFLSFVTYQFTSVTGRFADLKNDLKTIEPSEDNAYTNLNGEKVSLSQFKGDVLIVNSWATWSPFSKDELITLTDIEAQYDDRVTVLAINRKEPVAIIRAYLEAFDIPEKGLLFLSDPTDHFYMVSGGYAMPETIIYKKDGTIASHVRGVGSMEEIESVLKTLLE